jgi:hypothetical protein
VGDSWILQPEDPWEITGYVHNVVFTCGAVPEPDGTVKIYWGGADTVMCVGEAKFSDLVALMPGSRQQLPQNLPQHPHHHRRIARAQVQPPHQAAHFGLRRFAAVSGLM